MTAGRASTCPICRGPLPGGITSMLRLPLTAVAPEPQDEEQAWRAWQHAVRVERWIWFVFVIGLLGAGVVGLVRVSG